MNVGVFLLYLNEQKYFTMELRVSKEPQPGDRIVVWFSCGAASAIAARETIKKYGNICEIRVVNNPIKEEDDDNQRFLKDIEKWLNIKIERAINSKYPSCSCVEVWDDQQYMSNPKGLAYCTLELKQRARFEWEIKNQVEWTIMGYTKEEKKRFNRFILKRPSIHILKDITKAECFMELMNVGIELPRPYLLGMPNANCKGCIKATSPTYWNHVRNVYPIEFAERAKQSREIGAKLVRVKGKRIFLDELNPKARGLPMKNLNFECGIFCK